MDRNRMTLLADGAMALGVRLSEGQLDQFGLYYQELARWNRRVNLTAITGCDDAQVRHFLDSLTVCAPFLGGESQRLTTLPGVERVIDVGSGAGFPGLPLKLAFPELELHLVESVGKKTAFLEHLVDALKVEGVTIHTGRAEELARQPELRDSFDLALVRGLARLSLLLEYALPFCRHETVPGQAGGQTLALKYGGLDHELEDAEFALSELGGRYVGVFPVTLPGLTGNRVVAAFEKLSPTPERYPRRVGIPAKRPLQAKRIRG